MNTPLAALLIPELRWDPTHGFTYLEAGLDEWLQMGVGGFVIRNGPREAVATLVEALQREARHPLLIAAHAERGAGETLIGGTGLPPQGAFGALRDDDAIRRAARITARELRATGINWALAPCLDLALEPHNPVVGARSFGADAQKVAEWGVAWIDTCQSEGVMATAMHFPGIGRVREDPACAAARIDEAGARLWGSDLVPFRAAVDAGVATVLVSHVSAPRLAADASVATMNSVLLRELMRQELQFDGLLVSDSPAHVGARGAGDEGAASVAAIAAGCDLILAPHDVAGAAESLEGAVSTGALPDTVVDAALARRAFWADWGRAGLHRDITLEDVLWTRKVADTVVHAARGILVGIGPVVDVVVFDDDIDRAWQGTEEQIAPFLGALRATGLQPRVVDGATAEGRGAVVVAVFGEPRSGRGRAGYRKETCAQVAAVVDEVRSLRRSVIAVLFGPPQLAEELPTVPNVICAWGGDRAMQEAAARRLA